MKNKITDSQMTLSAEDLRNIVFDPLLETVVKQLGVLTKTSSGRGHVLLSGMLSECPYVSKYVEGHATVAELQDKFVLLKGVNG